MISDKIASSPINVSSIPKTRNSPQRLKKIVSYCAICHESLSISIDPNFFCYVKSFPFPHLVLHSHPDHAMHVMLLYIDAQGKIRGTEYIESVQFPVSK